MSVADQEPVSYTYTVQELKSFTQALTFVARSVVVDNITASWMSVNGGRPIPPFQYGVTIPFTSATNSPTISWSTPVGIPVPTPGNGTAYLTFTTEVLPPSNGQSVVVPSQQVPMAITTVNTVTGGTAVVGATSFVVNAGSGNTVKVTYTLPRGTNSLIITAGQNTTGAGDVLVVQINGVQSKDEYVFNEVTISDFPISLVIASAIDTQLIVEISTAAAGSLSHPTTFTASASFGTEAVAVQNAATPLRVEGPSFLGGAVPVSGAVGTSTVFSGSLVAGANMAVLGAGNIQVGVTGGWLSVDAVAATALWELQDSVGAVSYAFGSLQSIPWGLIQPAAINGGDGGLRLLNPGSATAFYRGYVVWL